MNDARVNQIKNELNNDRMDLLIAGEWKSRLRSIVWYYFSRRRSLNKVEDSSRGR